MKDLGPPKTITFPIRWTVGQNTHEEAISEIRKLASVISEAAEAILGVYMRLCDTIRGSTVTDEEARAALRPHFSDARISEILRVSHAPDSVYRKYRAGFFGFKAALTQCRLYKISPGEELKRRAVRRAAYRLVKLLQNGAVIKIKDRTITIS